VEHLGPAFTVAGNLQRPDGTAAREFRQEVALSTPGSTRIYYRTERYPMSDLRATPGVWKLWLLIDGELVGTYAFRLDDSASIGTRR
jgi:hypothetical protein